MRFNLLSEENGRVSRESVTSQRETDCWLHWDGLEMRPFKASPPLIYHFKYFWESISHLPLKPQPAPFKISPASSPRLSHSCKTPRGTISPIFRKAACAKQSLTQRAVLWEQKGRATTPDGHWCPELLASSQMLSPLQQEQSLCHVHGPYYSGVWHWRQQYISAKQKNPATKRTKNFQPWLTFYCLGDLYQRAFRLLWSDFSPAGLKSAQLLPNWLYKCFQ